jgi:hypothetical protein
VGRERRGGFWRANLKRIGDLKHLGVDVRMILKRMLKKQGRREKIGFM